MILREAHKLAQDHELIHIVEYLVNLVSVQYCIMTVDLYLQ